MIDDDSEPSISDTTPGAQVVELTDSLDLSRLHITSDDRQILATILQDLETELAIPCAHLAILAPDKSSVALAWRYRLKTGIMMLAVTLNLTDYSTYYTATTQKNDARVTYDNFATTVQALSILHINKHVTKVSNQPFALN